LHDALPISRFENAKHVTETIIDENVEVITSQIDTACFKDSQADALAFTIFNTSGYKRSGVVSVELDAKREYFSKGVNKKQLKEFPLGNRVIIDDKGNEYGCQIEDLGISFGYDLPDDKFRQPYMARRVRIEFEALGVPMLGYKTYALINKNIKQDHVSLFQKKNEIENNFFNIVIESNGS